MDTRSTLALVFFLAQAQAEPSAPGPTAIPLLDLARDASRQVVVDREKGRYLGHPTTVLLEDGKTIVAVYPAGHGKGPIIMKRSADGGRTWSERLETPENWATSLETPTIHRVVDENGVKRLVLFSGLYPVRTSRSEDDGKTWTPLEPAGEWGGIVAMASVVPVAGSPGEYVALFHDDGRFRRANGKATGTFELLQTRSRDGGLTWSEPVTIFASSDVHLCEPGVVRSPDGRKLAALLRENRRVGNSHVMFSEDEGRTWSPPRELPATLTGDRHVARYRADGKLFVSFRDMAKGSPTFGDWVAWIGTFADVENGRPGERRLRLMDNLGGTDCGYAGVEVLPSGTIVATSYGHWTAGEAPYIVSVRP